MTDMAPNVNVKPDLSVLLAKLARLRGKAVRAFRFAMLQQNQDGVEIDALPPSQQVMEMWRSRFPLGEQVRVPAKAIERTDYPLVWVSDSQYQAYIVKGQLSSGLFSAEDAEGNIVELSPDVADQGCFILLTPTRAGKKSISAPQSAKEWFRFAIRKHKKVFYEGALATAVISVLALFSSLYSMQVYDRVVPTKGFSTLWVLTIGVALAIIFEFAMKQVRAHIMDIACKKIDLELAGVFFGKAMDIRMDARPGTVGTFASQIRHFESVRNFMTSSTLYVMADAPFALFFIGVIALIGGPVALVPVVLVPLSFLVSLFLLRKVRETSRENMTESNMKNGLLIESIDGIESIKAAGGEWKMQDRYQALTATIANSDLKMKSLSVRATNLTQSVQQINYVGIIATGAFLITSGDLTMGGLIACSIIAGRALQPVAQIPQLIMQWNQAKIALEALDNIMAMPSDRDPDARLVVPAKCDGQIALNGVQFNYQQDKVALELGNISFQAGERVAVVGAVGSGKSTLVKLVSGLFKPSQGNLFLDGVDIEHLAPDYLRENIGYLPQDVRLFNGTLRENLTLGLPTPSDSQIIQACKLTGLDQVIANHPKGLELEISEGGRGLSGGQRQLVGLTRLLIAQPKIMLLDEPTASMDSQLESSVMRHLFSEIPKDSLLIVVTHKPAILPHVDRVVVIDKGRVVLDGPREKVMSLMVKQQSRPVAVKAG